MARADADRFLDVAGSRGLMPPSHTCAPGIGPVTVQRRVSQRGSIMVATQRIHVGMIHAQFEGSGRIHVWYATVVMPLLGHKPVTNGRVPSPLSAIAAGW